MSSCGFVPLPDGGRMAYELSGRQRPGLPVLLHRPLGGSMRLWGSFAQRLAMQHPVLAFDPRGIGRSSDVPLGHSTRAMAGDAMVLLDHLNIRRAHVFGLSLGGMVASWMALDAPHRVDHLILASTLPGPEAVSLRTLTRALSFTRCLRQPGVDFGPCLVHQVLSHDFISAHPGRVDDIDHEVRAMPSTRRNLILLTLMALRHSVDDCLSRITCPTLLLFGERDALAGCAARLELGTRLPNAILEIVANAGHDLSLEMPLELAARVSAFLEGTPD